MKPLVKQFIYEAPPDQMCHAPTIIETRRGLLASFFGGSREGRPDVNIMTVACRDGEWRRAKLAATGKNQDSCYPTWNPILFKPNDGPLTLFYKVGNHPCAWRGFYKTSENYGISWSPEYPYTGDLYGPAKNKPIQLSDGIIVAPCSTENDGWHIHFELSTDNGRSWIRSDPIEHNGIKAIQPTILVHSDNKLQAILRTANTWHLAQTWSKNRGRTWSPVELIDLPNPNTGADALTLADGRHLLVYNHAAGRWPIHLAVSRDGISWGEPQQLEGGPEVEHSYPAVIQTGDGLVHIVYTWGRVRIRHIVLDPTAIKDKL